MKKHGIALATLMMVFVLVGAVLYASTIVFASTTKKSVDSQISNIVNPVTINTNHTSSSDPQKTAYVTKQQVNGIEIEIVGKQVANNFLLVDMCFQLPSDNDWLLSAHPEDIVLTVGNKTIAHSGWSEVDEKTNANGGKIRCDQVKFGLSGKEDLSNFSISVNHLVTSMPEIPDCDKAQIKLDKKNAGIKIKCSKSDSSFSYEITQKPKNTSDAETRQSVDNAFRETVDGPWVFTDSMNN